MSFPLIVEPAGIFNSCIEEVAFKTSPNPSTYKRFMVDGMMDFVTFMTDNTLNPTLPAFPNPPPNPIIAILLTTLMTVIYLSLTMQYILISLPLSTRNLTILSYTSSATIQGISSDSLPDAPTTSSAFSTSKQSSLLLENKPFQQIPS